MLKIKKIAIARKLGVSMLVAVMSVTAAGIGALTTQEKAFAGTDSSCYHTSRWYSYKYTWRPSDLRSSCDFGGFVLYSANNKYQAVQQTDGNFVVYNQHTGQPIWHSGTYGAKKASKMAFQTDGNIVLYNNAGRPVWAVNGRTIQISPNWTRELVMQNDGNLVLYARGLSSPVLWHTGTSGR